MTERFIQKGDWVRINNPAKTVFHGMVGEVKNVYDSSQNYWPVALDVYLSKTPGFEVTRWSGNEVVLLEESDYEAVVAVLGEDYLW